MLNVPNALQSWGLKHVMKKLRKLLKQERIDLFKKGLKKGSKTNNWNGNSKSSCFFQLKHAW